MIAHDEEAVLARRGHPRAHVLGTGVREVDAILANSKWGGALGTSASVTYSFPSLVTQFDRSNVFGAYGADTGNADRLASADFRGFNEEEQRFTDQALAAFSAVANITFSKVDPANGAGTLRFNFTGAPAITGSSYAFSNFPMETADSGDTYFNARFVFPEGFAPGTQNFLTLTHEIGHAVGLKHPHDNGMTGVLAGWPDNNTTLPFTGTSDITGYSNSDSVMFYNDLPGNGSVQVDFSVTRASAGSGASGVSTVSSKGRSYCRAGGRRVGSGSSSAALHRMPVAQAM